MDLDALAMEFRQFRDRVEPMLADYEEHISRRDGHAIFGQRHSAARYHLESGRLDDAGKACNLERAHGGDESDESYERRLRAHVFGEPAQQPVKTVQQDAEEEEAAKAAGESHADAAAEAPQPAADAAGEQQQAQADPQAGSE